MDGEHENSEAREPHGQIDDVSHDEAPESSYVLALAI
jgi:hypothetical protein